jgi:hypothetical protein
MILPILILDKSDWVLKEFGQEKGMDMDMDLDLDMGMDMEMVEG